jgi:hypothetical protein
MAGRNANVGMFRRSFKWVKDKIKARDMFAIPVSLNFEGESQFRTGIGGCTTIVILLLLLAYASLLLKSVINKENSNVTKNSVQSDLTYDTTKYNVGKHGFNFGVALVHSNGTDISTDQSLVTMSMSQVTFKASTGGGFSDQTTDINFQLCTADSFSNLNSEKLSSLNVFSEFYCPATNDYVVSGNLIASEYNYIKILIKK